MSTSLRVLALNPYHGGSHQAFLEGWSRSSQHEFTTLTLPPFKWKWRMRHAALSFVERVRKLDTVGGDWDVIFCTDMLNLAEFRGLVGDYIAGLPAVAYFHENQLTYPSQSNDERDLHFAFTNMLTGLAADQVWFNSAFHRDEFLAALDQMLRRMPDHQPLSAVEGIRSKSSVFLLGSKHRWPGQCGKTTNRCVWCGRRVGSMTKDRETFFCGVTESCGIAASIFA